MARTERGEGGRAEDEPARGLTQCDRGDPGHEERRDPKLRDHQRGGVPHRDEPQQRRRRQDDSDRVTRRNRRERGHSGNDQARGLDSNDDSARRPSSNPTIIRGAPNCRTYCLRFRTAARSRCAVNSRHGFAKPEETHFIGNSRCRALLLLTPTDRCHRSVPFRSRSSLFLPASSASPHSLSAKSNPTLSHRPRPRFQVRSHLPFPRIGRQAAKAARRAGLAGRFWLSPSSTGSTSWRTSFADRTRR